MSLECSQQNKQTKEPIQPPQYVLEYWNIRGTTQTIRNLLEYLQINYENRVIQWPQNQKYYYNDLLAHVNMPNLRHGDMRVIEIVPIAKYICRKSNRQDLLGKNLKDEIMIDSFILKTFQARNVYLDAMLKLEEADESSFQKLMLEKLKVLKCTYLQDVHNRLDGKDWYVGYLSLADFFLFNALFYFQGFLPSLIYDDEVIENFMLRFQNIPRIKEYFMSGKIKLPPFISWEINRRWKGKRSYK